MYRLLILVVELYDFDTCIWISKYIDIIPRLKNLSFMTHILRRLYENSFRMWHGDIFVIKIIVFSFYNAHSKTIMKIRFRMWYGDIYVIIENLNYDGFEERTTFVLVPMFTKLLTLFILVHLSTTPPPVAPHSSPPNPKACITPFLSHSHGATAHFRDPTTDRPAALAVATPPSPSNRS